MGNMNEHVILTLGALNEGLLHPNDVVEFVMAPNALCYDVGLITRPTDFGIRMVNPMTCVCRNGVRYKMLVFFNLSPVTFYGGQTYGYDPTKFIVISAPIKTIEKTTSSGINEEETIGDIEYRVIMHNIRSTEVFDDFDSIPDYVLPSIGRVYSIALGQS